jgi:hypothetical protein
METLSFILGVAAVLIVIGIVVMFRMSNSLSKLKQTIHNHEEAMASLDRDISTRDELINRRVDNEVDRLNRTSDEIFRYIDSRLDKLESKILSKIPTNKEY